MRPPATGARQPHVTAIPPIRVRLMQGDVVLLEIDVPELQRPELLLWHGRVWKAAAVVPDDQLRDPIVVYVEEPVHVLAD